jgi:NADH/NAD ratio-sensing transcriptional regulator Rex
MTPEELHRLVEEYREGTISAEDARRLAAAIRSDGKAIRRELAFSGHLGQREDGATSRSSGFERLSAERAATSS